MGISEAVFHALNAEFNQFISVNRGGKMTKIHTIADGLCNPISFLLSSSQINYNKMAIPLPKTTNINGSHVLADWAYGWKKSGHTLYSHKADYIILSKQNAKNPLPVNCYLYKERHLVECFFNKLKQFRCVAARYDKLGSSFLAFIHISAIVILLK